MGDEKNMVKFGLYILNQSYYKKFSFIDNLNMNKEGRPQMLFIEDDECPDIKWVIPLTSKIEKVKALIRKERAKRGFCNKAYIIKIGKEERGVLIQDMIPILEKYVDHEYTINSIPVIFKNTHDINIITKYAKKWLALIKQDRKIFKTQIDTKTIYIYLIEEITRQQVAATS